MVDLDIYNHYERLDDLYMTLGVTDDDACCVGKHDKKGWYKGRSTSSEDWVGEGRAWALGGEFVELLPRIDRTLYTTLSYADASWFLNSWRRYQWDDDGDGRLWEGGRSNNTPDYSDIRAFAPFADIDLSDDLKHSRPGSDVPTNAIERALAQYTRAFADLAGGMEHVYALDSVGGAYVFVAPSATAPIAVHTDGKERGLIFNDLVSELNEWLEGVAAAVNDDVPAVSDGVFEPDTVNNNNRLYKAPLAVHKSVDGVVTPMDPEDPTYRLTPVDSVGEGLVVEAEQWAESFTTTHHTAVDSIVETLWPEYADSASGWEEAIDSRISYLKAEQERKEQSSGGRGGDSGDSDLPDPEEIPDDIEETDDIDIVKAKIEQVDPRDLIRRICDEWDTAPGRSKTRFDPSWRHSESGESCFVDEKGIYDNLEESGDVLQAVARDRGITRSLSDKLRGDDYWKAVNALREEGFDIPYFVGHDGLHPDGLRLYQEPEDEEDAQRQALRAAIAEDRRS